ncbi:MAG: DTW domain-containing protein [Elusimicrobiales bacterium]|nr:DTW domain-containing protein [Elusimicrobiales bacterium]
MLNGKDLPPALPAHREECYTCRRPKKNCLCGSAKPFATRLRFVILMHTKEAHKQRTGTARLAKLCLSNAELIVGTDFTRDERVNSLIRDPAYSPFVLYPGPAAVEFKALAAGALPAGKTPLVFVIDGTWRGAQRVLRKSHNVRALPRLSFTRGYSSQFIIKKQPLAHCVSTIEAIYYLCKEAQEAGYENLKGREEILMSIFKELVDTQLGYQKGKGRRREDPAGGCRP